MNARTPYFLSDDECSLLSAIGRKLGKGLPIYSATPGQMRAAASLGSIGLVRKSEYDLDLTDKGWTCYLGKPLRDVLCSKYPPKVNGVLSWPACLEQRPMRQILKRTA